MHACVPLVVVTPLPRIPSAMAKPAIHEFRVNDLAAATFTPYKFETRKNSAGDDVRVSVVDLDAVDAHCADLGAHDVRFAFINGTTGDSMSLSTEERKALAVSWVAAGTKYGVNIINHIGASSIEDTRILSAHAEEVGCDAVSCMPPFFFKTNSPRVVAEWLKEASDAAPTLPLYYYHFNVITGCYVDPLELIKACEETGVHTFRGFKFTDFNLWHYDNCVRYGGGKYDVAYGRDEAMLGGLALGAKGSIGNAFNFAAGVYQRMRKAFFAGDMETARFEQGRANSVVNIMNDARFGGAGLVVSRAIYELKGKVKLGPVRAPHLPMTADQHAALRAELDAIKFFEWCD